MLHLIVGDDMRWYGMLDLVRKIRELVVIYCSNRLQQVREGNIVILLLVV